MASALGLFARQGFEGTSLVEIANDAGVTPSLVHYYFASKEDLWKLALESVLIELRDDFRQLEAKLVGIDSLDALELVLRRFISFSSRHPELSLILRNERGGTGPRLEWLWQEHWAPLRALPLRLIAEAQSADRLRAGAPEHILQIIIGACLHPLRGRLSLHQIHGQAVESEEVFAVHADLVVAILLRGLEPRAD
jgi:TetR/AcrR family transcriptional regulator